MTRLRYALRVLRRTPSFTTATIVILASAIGANTAMFSILDAWFLRPLHFKESRQLLIALRGDLKHPGELPIFDFYRDYLDWKQSVRSLQGMSAMFWRQFTLTGTGEAENFMGMIVTADIFDTLGVNAQIGRTFLPSDVEGPPAVVISHQLWQERFGGARDVTGRALTLNGKSYQVVGVMPAWFSLRMENQSFDPKVLAVIQRNDPDYTPASMRPVAVIVRLKRGVDLASAQAELRTVQVALDAGHPETPKDFGVFLTRLQDDNLRFIGASLETLLAAVVFVMLVACANVAGLFMGRAAYRQREMAVRTALGSGRGALVGQLLTESLVLAVTGAALGLLFAYAGVRAFTAANPFNQLPPDPLTINGRALVVALGLAVVSTILFGVAPALEISRADLFTLLRTRAAGAPAGFGRNALVIAQIALSLILLTGATVLTKAVLRLASQPLGFRTDGVDAIELTLPGSRYATDRERRTAFYNQTIERLGQLPGVRSVAITTIGPLLGGQRTVLVIAGRPEPPRNDNPRFEQHLVTPGYFEALSVPILRGRAFAERDTEHAPPVTIINEAVARLEFPDTDPVGKQIRIGSEGAWRTIVGVAGSIRTIFYNTVVAKEPLDIYVPAGQASTAGFNPDSQRVWVLARTGRVLSRAEVRRQVDSVDREVPVGQVRTMEQVIDEATRQPRVRTTLLAGFALLALALSAIGIYGLISQNTARRTSEIGIRMALGAQPRDVLAMVIRQGVLLAAGGIVTGIGGALLLARAMSAFLYGASGIDFTSYVLIAGLVLGVAALAAWIPARRASRVNPMIALRYE
jgi:putative ABC transport system permease protein